MEFTLTWQNGATGKVTVPDPELRSILLGYWKRQQDQSLDEADRIRGKVTGVTGE